MRNRCDRYLQNRVFGVLLTAFLFLGSGCAEEEKELAPSIPRVKYFEVSDQATGQSRQLSGKVVAAESSPLSFRVKGTVSEVLVRQGDSVNEGQILAKLDTRELQLSVQQARASVNIARAKVSEANQSFQRAKRLFEQDAGSQAEVEKATGALAAARGDLVSAQSTLEQANRDLASAALVAPFSGTIASRSVEPFAEISAGAEVFILESEGAVEVEVSVPEVLIKNLDHGQTVRITFPTSPGTEISGTVNEIGSRTVAGNAFPVTIQTSANDLDLRAGMTASVLFNFADYLDEASAFLIPLSSLAIEAGMFRTYQAGQDVQSQTQSKRAPVFIVNDENELELRDLTVGSLRGNELEVFDGLEAGEKVVSAGVAFLRPGMKVKLWTAEQGLDDG